MVSSVMAHPACRAAIEGEGDVEPSYFWEDSHTGIQCRCRPDKIMSDEDGRLIDVKTTSKLSDFSYSVADYRYYVQEAFYLDGLAMNGIVRTRMHFLVIQKTIELGRYPCMLVTLPYELLEYGRMIYKQDLVNLKKWRETGFPMGSKELKIHDRFWNQIEDDQANEVY